MDLSFTIRVVITVLFVVYLIYIYVKDSNKTPPPSSATGSKGYYFKSQWGPIYYNVDGKKGQAVLLIHGLGASSYTWRHTVNHLKNDFKVVSVDLWGFGQSTKSNHSGMTIDGQIEILKNLMDSLKINQFSVVGHSMGGHLALWLALQAQPQVDKIVTIAPACHPKLLPKMTNYFKPLTSLAPYTGHGFGIQKVGHWFIYKTLSREIREKNLITDEMVEAYYKPYQEPDAHRCFISALLMLNDGRVFASLPQLKKKVLILWGEQDRAVKRKVILEIHKQLTNSQLVTNPKSRHLPMEDDPHWVNQQLFTFLKS